jgi:hypothetical protein
MGSLRQLIHGHLPAAWALLALSLAMKLLVPAGFMPAFSASGIAIVICSGIGPAPMAMHGEIDKSMAMPAMPAGHGGDHQAPAKFDTPCPFAGMSAPALGGADAIQLAIALVAIIAAGLFVAEALPIRRPGHLRPPLRGPPALG